MRIFIALLFSDEIKDEIFDYLEEVEEIAESGNFSYFDNLHLTVIYIGETSAEKLTEIIAKIKEIKFHAFEYKTNRLDMFKRDKSRKIVYLGVDKSYELQSLYNLVCVKLKEIGLDFPTNKYTPHITLGRQVSLIDDSDIDEIKTNPMNILVDRISIMESTRIKGQLTYVELDNVKLK